MVTPRWLTKNRNEEEETCFGVLFGDTDLYPGALNVHVVAPMAFAKCYFNVTSISIQYYAPQGGANTEIDFWRPVIYRPYAQSQKVALEDLYVAQLLTPERLSELRRKIEGFAGLRENWDGEGAIPISPETINTALQTIEYIAIVLERKNTLSLPSIRPFPDGSIFFKWIRGQKELAITVDGRNIEAQRWEPLDSFHSQGLWQLPVDAISEHVEWVLT